MRKDREISAPDSCWNKARDGELVFVMLERDPATPGAIRTWCEIRIALGKNLPGDPQIVEALELADAMEGKATR